MTIEQLPLLEQLMLVLSALVLFTSFVLLEQSRLTAALHAFAWQGGLTSAVTAIVALTNDFTHLYFSAFLTFMLKALLIPWMLHRMVIRLSLERQREPLQYPVIINLLAVFLVIFSYWLVLPLVQQDLIFTRNIVAVSLAIVLIGFLLMVVRRQAVVQVLGFMSMENGLFLAAVSATSGMPLVVELGIAFDVLVAVVLFGVFFFQIRESIDSLNVDRMNQLRERADSEL